MGAIFLQESVVYLHGAAFLTGLSTPSSTMPTSASTSSTRACRGRSQALVNGLGHTLLLMPLCIAIVVFSWDYAKSSWAVLEGSAEVAGVPAVFVLKTLIPVSAALLFVQAGSLAWREFRSRHG